MKNFGELFSEILLAVRTKGILVVLGVKGILFFVFVPAIIGIATGVFWGRTRIWLPYFCWLIILFVTLYLQKRFPSFIKIFNL